MASDLLILDPTDGSVVTTVGPIGFAMSALAIDPRNGILYGSTSNNSAASPRSLIRIDRMTGAGTLIGAFGVGGTESMADLAFAPGGTLFGSGSEQNLYTIDASTGAATLIGSNGHASGLGNGLATAGGTLFYAGDELGTDGDLYTQNPTNAALTSIASLTGAPGDPENSITAMSFAPDGALFAAVVDTDNGGNEVRGTAYLTVIDVATGAVQNRGGTVRFLDAIAFASSGSAVPAVATPTLLAVVALLGVLGLYRVRRGARS